jgi:hypothetical protein
MLKFCLELHGHKRPICILGGSAQMWDVMVTQLIAICRSQGIMTIDGVHYLSAMEKDIDGWHVAKTYANVDKVGSMFFDVLHAAVACIPWGSFATLQPIPEASWSQDPTLAAIATTGAFSTQVETVCHCAGCRVLDARRDRSRIPT